ncbi:aggregation-promoting factor C-terminal-like domain-containing protein, partial [Pediococcus parvulus]|nr:peptidoglycan-binding protein LysM [Pediococcus parvulus]MCT3031919.1 peptidoglycan-binding protein LysM [Pediococcus parvulus]
ARNGQYVGKYQLSASYLNGDYSAANQEKVANLYVSSRYGSWSAAKAFWQANGWY